MKKCCCALFIILLLLSGCALEENGNKVVKDMSELYQTEEEYPAQSYWKYANMKKTDTGYYFLLNGKLYYWDLETQKGMIYCSASNCSHDSADCSAYFGRYGEDLKYGYPNLDLEIYNNHIYIMGFKIDEVADVYIYSMNLDGNEREQIAYLYSKERESDGGVTFTYDWVMIDGYYYGPYSSDNESFGLYKIRVDGEKTLAMDISDMENASIHRVQGIEKYVCFNLEWTEGSEAEGNLLFKSNLMRYDTETEEVEILIENDMICEYCFLDEEHIFYSDIEGKCYLVDLKTKEEICIIESGVEGIISSDGKYLYLDNFSALCVYTSEGALVDEIPMNAGQILFGDENYLFVNAPVEPGQEFTDEQYSTTYLWILDKSQLGTEEKQWMKMELE